MRLVTVFGASGFVGRHTVYALCRAGWQVRAVCRRPNLANYLLPAGTPGQVQLFRGNVLDKDAVTEAVQGADAVVNCVGVLSGHGGQGFSAMHIDAARRIADAAKAAGVTRLVQISAIGANPMAQARYAQSKGEGEAVAREAFTEVTILRPSLIFGPEDAFFNYFATLAGMAPALPLIGGGKTRFQPVFVGDVAKAVVRTLENESCKGKIFELGGPDIYSFRELMQYLLGVIRRKRLLLPVPFVAGKILGFFLQIPALSFPVKPMLTVDQVRLLKRDTIVHPDMPGLKDLGIIPTPIEEVVPDYLARFRSGGVYESAQRAH